MCFKENKGKISDQKSVQKAKATAVNNPSQHFIELSIAVTWSLTPAEKVTKILEE